MFKKGPGVDHHCSQQVIPVQIVDVSFVNLGQGAKFIEICFIHSELPKCQHVDVIRLLNV